MSLRYDIGFLEDAERDPPDPPLYDEPWDDEDPPKTWDTHPSLTAEQRNSRMHAQ